MAQAALKKAEEATAAAKKKFKRIEYFQKGSWRPYAPADVRALNSRGQHDAEARLKIADSFYDIDFERLTQRNVVTRYTRSIRYEDFDGKMHEPPCPIAGAAEDSQFDAKQEKAKQTFAGKERDGKSIFTEVADRSTKEFREVSLKLLSNMQKPGKGQSKAVTGAAVICIHRIDAKPKITGDFKELIEVEGVHTALEAWHGAPPQAIIGIVQTGFVLMAPRNQHKFGHGVYLAPLDAAWMSCDEKYAEKDKLGIKHILLCDFAQGKPELIHRGSQQAAPTLPCTTGVDDLSRPTRYIVWSNDMNQRILPKYVVSFSLGGK